MHQPGELGGGQRGPRSRSTEVAAAQAASQPGTPGAVHVAIDHLPSLSSQSGTPRSPGALPSPAWLSTSGAVDGQQPTEQQQQKQQAAQQRHPWQAQASSRARIVSFKAWSQTSDNGAEHRDRAV